MKIYIIEDEVIIRNELATFLMAYGYDCTVCKDDFNHVVEDAINSKADLILLDINLPGVDGYHICRELRKQSDVPIIMVTSRNTDMDELMGINLGADDFITKPYNNNILLARIESLLKRVNKKPIGNIMEHKGLTLYLGKSVVEYDNKKEELTKNELKILTVLMKNAGEIISRDELMDELWQCDEFVDDNTLTVNVNRLRRKLKDLGVEDYISTRRGQGYIV